MEVRDSNGTILQEGDSVQIIKSIKVKGSTADLKRGQIVKNIKLTDNSEEVEGRVDKVMMVLKTNILKKA
jgi:protein PhnA